jgi:hypothetical protein
MFQRIVKNIFFSIISCETKKLKNVNRIRVTMRGKLKVAFYLSVDEKAESIE